MPPPLPALEWRRADGLTAYDQALAFMDQRVRAIQEGQGPETIWLLEHPPLYTAGTSARADDLLQPDRLPVHHSGRGGQYTYHGPGQRVVYLMLDLRRRRQDVHWYVRSLEEWIIRALALLGVHGERRPARTGVWVARGSGREDKIAAIGVRIRRWITFHGIAINVAPNLEHFTGIVPCGIQDQDLRVTSLEALGVNAAMADLDAALRQTFDDVFPAPKAPSHSAGGEA